MVRREMVASRAEAQRLIGEGRVLIRGLPTPKPASLITTDTPIELVSDVKRWVSRGALKMLAALESFPVAPEGERVLDVGASTGGFTEALLAAGAEQVVALDVGRGQLHESLRRDPRVVSIERTNFRSVDIEQIDGPFPLVVADVSFISLCTLAGKLAEAATRDLVVLVKPQFEAGKGRVGQGGVVRDQATRESAVVGVIECLGAAGLGARGLIRSPIEGGDGNIEYLLWLRKGEAGLAMEVPG